MNWTVLYCTVMYYTSLYCRILHSTVLKYTVLYCTGVNYNKLYCTALHCSTQTVSQCTHMKQRFPNLKYQEVQLIIIKIFLILPPNKYKLFLFFLHSRIYWDWTLVLNTISLAWKNMKDQDNTGCVPWVF